MGKKLEPLTRWSAFAGFFGLLLVAIFTCLDVIGRWLFSAPINGFDDIAGLAFCVAVAACFPAVLLHGDNITIRFLGAATGRKGHNWLELFGAVVTLGFVTLLAVELVAVVIDAYESGDTTVTVGAPTWPWWTMAMVLVVACVPIQLIVAWGEARRAVRGGGEGGTVPSRDDDLLEP